MHKNLLKIGRTYSSGDMIADRQTHTETDRHVHHSTPRCPSGGGVRTPTQHIGRQQLRASTLHTSSTTTTHAADDDDTSRLVAPAAQREWQCIQTTTQKNGSQLSSAAIIFSTWRKLANFFTYIRPKESRSISYNSVYLILACAENFTATVTLYVLC